MQYSHSLHFPVCIKSDTDFLHQQVSKLVSASFSSVSTHLSPLPEDHTWSRPAPPRFCRDDPDGRGFHEVPVDHLVLLSPGHRLQLGGGFWAPVCHEFILGFTIVHYNLLRLLPKQPVWKEEREETREKHQW